jgi:protein-S-isoprenylcysteine O-methyltransferase Ste14
MMLKDMCFPYRREEFYNNQSSYGGSMDERRRDTIISYGETLFRYRDITPVPLVILFGILSQPTLLSATMGTLIILLGEFFRVYSVAFIGPKSRTHGPVVEQLVTTGPFRWVRNPLYIANGFILVGFSVYSAHSWLLILSLLFCVLQYGAIVAYEEQRLEETFGDEYRAYCQEVPAWIPKNQGPWVFDHITRESLWMALKSEKRTLTGLIAGLALMIMKG